MINLNELKNRFSHHPPNDRKKYHHEFVRTNCQSLAVILNQHIPEGREKALAMTKLEEVMFWANAGIARNNGKEGS